MKQMQEQIEIQYWFSDLKLVFFHDSIFEKPSLHLND